ncbi:hypothetical protein CMV30_10990 [Nibricoccus aquaticus]|uniref:Uncharacterized protein n=1 Tax=Nibricoccus aquaticus TaxID=2576891 RepID=A0A290QDV7_9BACT|nr:hypothetical protein [Nibricoccus aquaticus]ATC64436.1 hypothetical protein CMV30_10990 [Nibricoccus aquaticus]
MKPPAIILLFLVMTCFAQAADRSNVATDAALEISADAMNELWEFESLIASLKYPLTVAESNAKLGGSSKIKWCCTHGGSGERKSRMEFEIITPRLKGLGYMIVLSGRELVEDSSEVSEVLLGFRTPLGGIYYADLSALSSILRDKGNEHARSPAPVPNKAK